MMEIANRAWTIGSVCLLLATALARPAAAQPAFDTPYQTTDFTGEWSELEHEIGTTADLYDYSGLPYNAAGRMRADTGDISDWSINDFVCRPHPGIYNWYYGGGLRITKEVDPISRELIAYHVQFFRGLDRPIYMDGRPHPPEDAPHTWAGFSTGVYEGNMLKITTTHMRESYIRANTALFSEKATATEYLMLDGDLMTVTTYLDDPAYMEEHISAINTVLTGFYLLVALPIAGVHLPLAKTMIAVVFLVGLLPIVGNLISNSVIVVLSLSVSLSVAIASLVFLVVIHKLEYFLNAHIVGTQVRAHAWELLIAMVVMEAGFGIAGLVAAPIYYAYLKDELLSRRLI
jgi:hypothetical protein